MSSEARFAVVTGGSAGIGKSVCQHLLDAGYEVVSLARRQRTSCIRGCTRSSVDLTDAPPPRRPRRRSRSTTRSQR